MAKKKVSFLITAKDQASKVFRMLNSTMKTVSKTVGGITKALGKFTLVTGATATAVALLSKRIMEQIDSIDKVSKKIGVTVDFLQKLRFASDIAGVEIRTTDMALQRFTRRMAEARTGTGESIKALKELGVAFVDSEGNFKSTEEVFIDVAEALVNVESRADQLRLGFKLFDSEGVGLINTMNELLPLFDRFDELGLGVDKEIVDKVAQLKDTFTEIGAIVDTIKMATFGGLADEIDKIVSHIRDKLMTAIGDNPKDFAEQLGDKIIKSIKAMVQAFEFLLNKIVAGLNGLMSVIDKIDRKFDLGLNIFGDPKEIMERKKYLENAIATLDTKPISTGSFFIDKFNLGQDRKNKEAIAKAMGLDPSNFEESDFLALREKISSELTAMGEQVFFENFNFYQGFVKLLDDALGGEGSNKVIPKTTSTTEDEDTRTAISKRIDQFVADAKKISSVEIADSMIDGIKSIEDSFVQMFEGSTQGFKDLAQSIKTNFIRFLVQEFISSGLLKLMSSFGFNTQADSFGGRMIGSLFGRANGGTILAGQTALVGERGAEVITANQDLMVKPANQTRDLLANTGGANVNFNITASDVNGFDELLVKRKNLLISLINEGMNKNGKAGLV